MAAESRVFTDETPVGTTVTCRSGRCRRGERLVMAVSHGHRKPATPVLGLRPGGPVAPTGRWTGETFLARKIEKADGSDQQCPIPSERRHHGRRRRILAPAGGKVAYPAGRSIS